MAPEIPPTPSCGPAEIVNKAEGVAGAKKGRGRPKAVKRPVAVREGGGGAAGLKKKTSKRGQHSYKTYIYKVMKLVHPECDISSKAMEIMNSFIVDILEKLSSEAARLTLYNKKQTFSSGDIKTAVRLCTEGTNAVTEGTNAVTRFTTGEVAA